MAQSIYVTLETLETETSVPAVMDKNGEVIRPNMGSVKHTLPRANYPTPEIFDNEDEFLEWAQENNCLLSLLQEGISGWLISDRAIFKQMVKGKWSSEIGQSSVDSREWSTSKRPENAKSDEQKAIDILGKMTPDQIAEMLKKLGK